MEQRRQNYKSDFAIRERFRNAAGDVVALPDVDFELRYWTRDPDNVYTAKRDNGVMTNCMADGDAVLVLLQHHGLGEGELHHELHLKLDNIVFDDGIQNVYYPENMNILLWNGKSDTDGVLESDAIADYLSCETMAAKEAAERAAGEALAAKDAIAQMVAAAIDEAHAAKDEVATAVQQTQQAIDSTLQAKETAEQQNDYIRHTVDTVLEVMAIHAAAPNSGLATGMVLSYPKQITLGNDIAFIRATVTPATVEQAVRFISDDVACEVDTGGNIRIKQVGSSRIHVIPAAAPQYYKTINIDVVPPRLRLAGNRLRLDGNGNIRLT